jgi:hypothetical protein
MQLDAGQLTWLAQAGIVAGSTSSDAGSRGSLGVVGAGTAVA